MLTRGGPAGRTENLSIYIYRVAFSGYHFGYAAALSVVMMIMAGFIAWSLIKSIKFNI
jgi:ABC-type sugar transport system permease subunit